MVFSSAAFLYFFLVFTLVTYYLVSEKYKNITLLCFSLLFYFIGEKALVLLMIGSISVNYLGGIIISKYLNSNKAKFALFVFIILNLSLLFYYKYLLFTLGNFQALGFLKHLQFDNIIMPVGISFFTFQSISYLVDVYRKSVSVQKNIINLGLYISLFPQLIAGPIVRYEDIEKQLRHRIHNAEKITDGIIRFIRGIAKKILIANVLGEIADSVFAVPAEQISTSLSWVGIIAYTLQIFFDFSGYSDMAIGLGKIFGFDFKENFKHPYISKSIKEFWQRWHISLSTWFKDYVYIPLGGSRKGSLNTYRNLMIVFIATGIWHGASWNFLIWGLYYGLFLILEKVISFKYKIPNFLKSLYVLSIVIVGWVLFKSEDINSTLSYLHTMFVFKDGSYFEPYLLINGYVIFIFLVGILFSMPIRLYAKSRFIGLVKSEYYSLLRMPFYLILFVFTLSQMAINSFNPFIYFRF